MTRRVILKSISAVVALLFSWSAAAAVKVEVLSDASRGTVTSSVDGTVVTLTIAPAEGYYVSKNDISAVKTFMPTMAPRRSPVPIADELTLVGNDPDDLSQPRSYTVTLPGEEYGLLVNIRYAERQRITEQMVRLSETLFVYNEKEQRPTVIIDGLTEGRDFTVQYAEPTSVAAGTYTLTVTGRSTWTGSVTRTYKIFAGGKAEVNNSLNGGTIATAVDGLTVTLTVTPADGYYVTKKDITLAKTYMPVAAPRRTIPVADLLELTGEDPDDLSLPRTYTAQLPGWEYSVYVDATFTQRQTITSTMVTLSASSFVYNGSDQKPTVNVKGLKEGKDYLLDFAGTSWSDVGTYSLTVTGRSTWKGVISRTYTITKAPSVVTVAPQPQSLIYSGSAQHLVAAGEAVGGTLMYSLDGTTYQAAIPTGVAAGSYTIYYKVQGDSNHTDTEVKSVTATITKKAIIISGIAAQNKVYDGTTAATLVYDAVVFGGMAEGDALTVTAIGTFSDANAGSGKVVTLSALTLGGASIGNYQLAESGQQTTATATITSRSIEGAVFGNIAAQSYSGEALTPVVTVTLDNQPLVGDKDYTVSYADNVNVGEATVTVTGAGNYQGAVQTKFIITPVAAVVTLAPQPQTLVYSGNAQQLVAAGEAEGGTLLYSLDGTDYQESIPTGIAAGSYTIYYKVQGDSNHTDSNPATVVVTMGSKELSQPTILLSSTSYIYDGTVKEPDVTVKDGETVIPATEYVVTYESNVNAGDAKVIITDVEGGNYIVSGEAPFTIMKADAVVVTTPKALELDYNGEAQVLVSGGETIGGVLVYSLDGESYDTALPIAIEPALYTVYYKVIGDDNHFDTEVATASAVIRPQQLLYESGGEANADIVVDDEGNVNVVINELPEGFFEGTAELPTTLVDENSTEYGVTEVSSEAFNDMPSDVIVVLPENIETTEPVTNVVNGDGTCETIDLTEVKEFSLPIDVEAGTVVYDREVTNGSTTVCLPYDLPVPENTTAYFLDVTDGEGVTLQEVEGVMEAYQPYVLVVNEVSAAHAYHRTDEASAYVVDLGMTNVTFSHTAEAGSVERDNFTLCGTMHTMTHEEGLAMKAYVLQPDNSWRITASSDPEMAQKPYLAPFQAYLLYTGHGEMDEVATTFDSITTCVQPVKPGDKVSSETGWYDLNGRKLGGKPTRKGVYLHQRKVIVH